MFTLTAEHLKRLCELNGFPIASDQMVFLGFRGCLPVNPNDHAQKAEQALTAANVDWTHPRCTLAQWLPAKGTFAVFPGSTAPHVHYIAKAKKAGGAGANQMITGYYDDYRKGTHLPGKSGAHEAFRQTESRIVRRSSDDLDFDNADPVSEGLQFDNLHAASCGSVDDTFYGSAGCQVVVGFPKSPARNGQPNTGPWKAFHRAAYDLDQVRFGYALFNGTDVKRIALAGDGGMVRVRGGSRGTNAGRVQKALKDKGFYEGVVDSDFGPRSLRALLEFQTAVFGPLADDGICGPQTAEALGIELADA